MKVRVHYKFVFAPFLTLYRARAFGILDFVDYGNGARYHARARLPVTVARFALPYLKVAIDSIEVS